MTWPDFWAGVGVGVCLGLALSHAMLRYEVWRRARADRRWSEAWNRGEDLRAARRASDTVILVRSVPQWTAGKES